MAGDPAIDVVPTNHVVSGSEESAEARSLRARSRRRRCAGGASPREKADEHEDVDQREDVGEREEVDEREKADVREEVCERA